MGANLAKVAALHAARVGLGHAASRLLAHMAVYALDTPTPNVDAGLYFASRSTMALEGLGYNLPHEKPAPDAPVEEHRAWNSARKNVERALNECIQAGAVERLEAGRRGYNASFRLTVTAVEPALLNGPEHAVDYPRQRPDSATPSVALDGHSPSPYRDTHRRPIGPLSVAHKRTEENLGRVVGTSRPEAPSHLSETDEQFPKQLRSVS